MGAQFTGTDEDWVKHLKDIAPVEKVKRDGRDVFVYVGGDEKAEVREALIKKFDQKVLDGNQVQVRVAGWDTVGVRALE